MQILGRFKKTKSGDGYSDVYNAVTKSALEYSVGTRGSENIVISPFSILMTLSMLCDGAGADTREEIIKAIGGESGFGKLQKELGRYQKQIIRKDTLSSANGMIIRKNICKDVLPGYLDRVKKFYSGEVFSSDSMAEDINAWINKNTAGMIPHMLDQVDESTLLSIINAVAFDAEWKEPYERINREKADFINADNSKSKVYMLRSEESLYVENGHFTGIVKPYKDERFSYMALLPENRKRRIDSKMLSACDLTALFMNRRYEPVFTLLPEYEFRCGSRLDDYLKAQGIRKAFTDEADFSRISQTALKIDEVIQKAYIKVDIHGTKAGAATMTLMRVAGGPPRIPFRVTFDRPFIFSIMDNELCIPVFAGVVNHLDSGE